MIARNAPGIALSRALQPSPPPVHMKAFDPRVLDRILLSVSGN